jgi:hypothetical protein
MVIAFSVLGVVSSSPVPPNFSLIFTMQVIGLLAFY